MAFRYYQNEWYGINFKDLGPKDLASEDFYHLFYKKLQIKFPNFSDFPKSFTESKMNLVNFYSNVLRNSQHVLSIGSGTAFVEKELINRGIDIDICEPATESLYWLRKERPQTAIFSGFFPEALAGSKKNYDCIIINAVEYVFNNDELENFVYKIANSSYLRPGGEVIIASASVYRPTFKRIVSLYLEQLKLFSKKWYFWGYLRTGKETHSILQKHFQKLEYQMEHGFHIFRGSIK